MSNLDENIMSDWQDHYFVLGVNRNASWDEIRDAYRFKAFTQHPDRLREAPESVKHRAEEELKKLNAAYDILRDPQKRDQYNLEWDKRNQSNPKTKPNQPPFLTKLECDHPSPQVSGSTIVCTAFASDPDGDPIYYRFWLKGASTANIWHSMMEWTKDNGWIWKTTSKDVGNNQIKVEVRDGYHSGTSGSDDFKIIDMTINTNWDSRFEMNVLEKKFFNTASKRIPDLIPQYEVRTSAGKLYRIDFAKIINYDSKGNKLLKIAIELDGPGHGEEKQRTDDAERQHSLELDGWRFIRFTSDQIDKDLNHCINVTGKLIEKQLKDLLEEKNLESSSTKVSRPLSISKLFFDAQQPQYPGSVIRWTAEAASPDYNPIYYRFWLRGPETNNWHSMTDWTRDNSWTWRPKASDVGNNTIKVEVRDGKHAGSLGYDDQREESYIIRRRSLIYNTESLVKVAAAVLLIFVLIWFAPGFFGGNKQPEISGLTSNTFSPKVVGSTIDWTTLASDPENDHLYYRYFLDGKHQTDWSTDKTWAWDTSGFAPGIYKIEVWIRDGKHATVDKGDAIKTEEFTLTAPPLPPNSKPIIESLTSDVSSPQNAGTTISWTASARDPEGDQIDYEFRLRGPSIVDNWRIVQDWGASNTWIWKTMPSDGGNYQIAVDVRDGKHAGLNDYDAEAVENYVLNKPLLQKPKLNPEIPSPQNSGAIINWEATGLGPSSETIYYRFLLSGPSTGNTWKVTQNWNTSNTWSWVTSASNVGDNEIKVQVRDGYQEGYEKFDAEETSVYSIIREHQTTPKPYPIVPPDKPTYVIPHNKPPTYVIN